MNIYTGAAAKVIQLCSFDHALAEPWCDLAQCYNDDGDWAQVSGPSPVPDTGPETDRSGQGIVPYTNKLCHNLTTFLLKACCQRPDFIDLHIL